MIFFKVLNSVLKHYLAILKFRLGAPCPQGLDLACGAPRYQTLLICAPRAWATARTHGVSVLCSVIYGFDYVNGLELLLCVVTVLY